MVHIEAYTGNEPYIFVSYSHKDTQVSALMQEMADNGYRFWYDEGIKSGRSWSEEISRRLKGSCQFVVFLSPNAVASDNVKDEIHLAKKYKIDLQVIYLEETQLDDGLELMLDRTQGILLYKYGDDRMRLRKLVQALKADAQQSVQQETNDELTAFLQRYEIISRVSTGTALTELLIARQTACNGKVFIKHYSLTNSVFGRFVRQDALEELEILKQMRGINCPFVPMLIDSYVDNGHIYIVEQYLGDNTLEKALESFDRTDPKALQQRCVSIAVKIAKALSYLHFGPIPMIHRDMKPSNLVLSEYGDVFIIDFGICLRYTGARTEDGIALGTIGYAAPEQHGDNRSLDPRADIHALGVTLLQMLTGVDPRVYDFDSRAPLRKRDARLDPGLEEVILKMTAKDPNDRYGDVQQVVHALENYKARNVFSAMAARLRSWKRLRAARKAERTSAEYSSTGAVTEVLDDVTTVLSAWQAPASPQPIPVSPQPIPVKPQPVAPVVTGILRQESEENC